MEKSGTSDGVMDARTPTTIKLNIKFSGRSIPISLSPDSTVRDLKSLLQPLTNVLTRGQKLIFKGRVLADGVTLRESEIADGARVMLMASQGLHQGSGPILKEAPTRPILRETALADPKGSKRPDVFNDKDRLERWKLTGVIALSECQLKAIPDEVWVCGPSTRVLDLNNNSIRDVPVKIGCLSSMQKLFLNANDILDASISWKGVVSLNSLTILSLSQNYA